MRYGFELAAKRPRKLLASATKSNALQLLDGAVGRGRRAASRKDYPDGRTTASITSTRSPRGWSRIPQTLDVIVASNLFGDILTDIGSAISGSLGIAPGGNINPERTHPSMFEPIHGSAPDIAGKGIANPIGAIWAGALMLDHLGERAAHDRIVAAIERVFADGQIRTPDLGGNATTAQVGAAVAQALTGETRQPA